MDDPVMAIKMLVSLFVDATNETSYRSIELIVMIMSFGLSPTNG